MYMDSSAPPTAPNSCRVVFSANPARSNERPMIDHFVSTSLQQAVDNIEAMEIHIREAAFEDLKHILHHRRAMFDEMGFRETSVLDRAEELSREYLSEALRLGAYRGWL